MTCDSYYESKYIKTAKLKDVFVKNLNLDWQWLPNGVEESERGGGIEEQKRLKIPLVYKRAGTGNLLSELLRDFYAQPAFDQWYYENAADTKDKF